MTTWIKQENKTSKTDLPTVSIRRLGLGLNSVLVKNGNLEDVEFVDVFISDDKKKLALKFYKEKTESAYLVTQDGGSKERKRVSKTPNRFVACGNVIRSNRILKELSERSASQKLVAKKVDDLWVVNIVPCFIYNTKNSTLNYTDTGVYRYILNNDIVYIGRGKIKDRITSVERKEWEFDDIEFLLTTDEESRSIEETLLQEYKDSFGCLPRYNKILGCK